MSAFDNKEKKPSKFDLNNMINDFLKDHPETTDLHSQVRQNISQRVISAGENHFTRLKMKKQGLLKGKVGKPRKKSNENRVKSITFPQYSNGSFSWTPQWNLKVGSLGELKVICHRKPEGKIKTLTIIRKPTGKWFVCLVYEIEDKEKITKPENPIGIDLGSKRLVNFSDGSFIDHPRFKKNSIKKIEKAKEKAKKTESEKDWRIHALLHEKVSNQRDDFLHKTSRMIVREYDCVCLENLDILSLVSK